MQLFRWFTFLVGVYVLVGVTMPLQAAQPVSFCFSGTVTYVEEPFPDSYFEGNFPILTVGMPLAGRLTIDADATPVNFIQNPGVPIVTLPPLIKDSVVYGIPLSSSFGLTLSINGIDYVPVPNITNLFVWHNASDYQGKMYDAIGMAGDREIAGFSIHNTLSFYFSYTAGALDSALPPIKVPDTAKSRGGGSVRYWTFIEDENLYVLFSARLGPPSPCLEVIDPNAFPPNVSLLDDQGQLVTDPTILATGGVPAKGAVTDGVTKLLLRVRSNSPVTFSIKGAPNDGTFTDGSLSVIGNATPQVSVNDVEPKGTQSFAFAVYTVPKVFSPQASTELTRTITTTAVSDDGSVNTEFPIMLERPPVVCVHGIWADISTCVTLVNFLRAHNFRAYFADYSMHAAESYDPELPLNMNKPVAALVKTIKAIQQAYRNRSIAITQVDIVAHSMGGLVTRASTKVKGFSYKRRENFKRGDINRLITVGTPHLGTPMANFILRTPCLADPMLADGWEIDPTIHTGVEALRIGSQAQQHVNDTSSFEVPTHTIAGVANGFQEGSADLKFNSYYDINLPLTKCSGNNFPGVRAIYLGDNDLLVPLTSQQASRFLDNITKQTSKFKDIVHSKAFHEESCKNLSPFEGQTCLIEKSEAEMESSSIISKIFEILNEPNLDSFSLGQEMMP